MVYSPKLYEQVAGKIKTQIENGILGQGQKVPSVRRFSRQLGVSAFTVVQAYSVLESQGILESRPNSGFYVRPLDPVSADKNKKSERPSTLSLGTVKSLSAKIQSVGYVLAAMTNPSYENLSFGFSSQVFLSIPNLVQSLKSGLNHLGPSDFGYNWPFGQENLRKQLARYYFDFGLSVSPEQILLTTGCSESLNICLKTVTQPGDIVAIESPMLPVLMMCFQALRVKLLEIPIDPVMGMDLDYLKRALRKYPIRACLSMPNFSHPTGSLMPDSNKKRLVEMLADRDVELIENDIYGDLHFDPLRPRPAKAFDKSGNVLLCSSFSKSLSPALRVGWIVCGKNFNQTMNTKFMGNASSNPLIEAGLAKFMKEGKLTRHIRKTRKYLEKNLDLYSRAMAQYFPEGTRFTRPRGGLFFWVRFPEKVDSFKLHQEALAKNLFLYPGTAFTLTPKFKNYISLSFGHKWTESIEKGLETIGALAKKQLMEKK